MTGERYNASVRLIRPVEAAWARASSQAGYFPPPAALMNASRSVTSFTSITTSDNGRDKHSKRPFVHVIHGPAAPAHKATFRVLAKGDLGADAALASGVGCRRRRGRWRRRGDRSQTRRAMLGEGAALPRLSDFSSLGVPGFTAARVTASHQ
jgi:hypothetical protein